MLGRNMRSPSSLLLAKRLGVLPTAQHSSRAEWSVVTAVGAPCARSSHQISGHGSRVYVFGGEAGPTASHFGYGDPVPSILY